MVSTLDSMLPHNLVLHAKKRVKIPEGFLHGAPGLFWGEYVDR